MKKIGTALAVLVIVMLVVLAAFFLIGYLRPKSAGLLIQTNPSATVFIDGEEVGKTPYEGTRAPGEVVIKLVPISTDKPLVPYETRLTLSSKIQTTINRDLAETEEASAGETVSFERVGGAEAPLAIVAIPDSAQVSLDGQLRGFAPYKTTSFPAGDHEITVAAPAFLERSVKVRTIKGYKLTLVVKLAPSGQAPEPTPTFEEVQVSMVEILATPTGFLRVRATPATGGEVVAEVKPGEKFRYLETDEATGWFKIEYQKGKEGWVSNQYAKKIEAQTNEETPP
ncbi:hypothetical protein A2V61_03870 [Candidatus Woesebacteria bacterium RBG_19FT_COMBO_47_8]|nr:MAG: hypothetical protein A2V61_03870 [Candidatus Woesebacteria bacterium RBG_19FT_COMBO_47_8]